MFPLSNSSQQDVASVDPRPMMDSNSWRGGNAYNMSLMATWAVGLFSRVIDSRHSLYSFGRRSALQIYLPVTLILY